MTPKTSRADIAARLAAALPAGWSAFASPPESPSVPCAYLAPRTPYRELATLTQEVMRLRVGIVGQRAMGQSAMDWFDDVLDDVKAALDAADDSITWHAASIDGVEEVNGIAYLTAHVDITVH